MSIYTGYSDEIGRALPYNVDVSFCLWSPQLPEIVQNIQAQRTPIALHVLINRRRLVFSTKLAVKVANFSPFRPVIVRFAGEDAVDDGGPRREFFTWVCTLCAIIHSADLWWESLYAEIAHKQAYWFHFRSKPVMVLTADCLFRLLRGTLSLKYIHCSLPYRLPGCSWNTSAAPWGCSKDDQVPGSSLCAPTLSARGSMDSPAECCCGA